MSIEWNANLRSRIVIGFSGGVLLMFVAYAGGWYFWGFVLLLTLLSLYELQIMGSNIGFRKINIIPYIFAAAALLDMYWYTASHLYLLIVAYIFFEMIAALFLYRENQLFESSYTLFTTLYAVLFSGSLVLLRQMRFSGNSTAGYKVIWCIFLGIWVLDTAAYFVGKSIGRQKLFPEISPKKTVEGGTAGLCGALVLVIVSKYIYFNELRLSDVVIIGIIIGIFGQIGDAVESFIKRKTGVKDSSSVLPGHGGILDRFDSLIFVSPFIYFYVKYFSGLF